MRWFLVDRRGHEADDQVVDQLIADLLATIDRLEKSNPLFGRIYARLIADLVRRLDEQGVVVRWEED